MLLQFIKKNQFSSLFVLVLLSRLPFLAAGFGIEEDSWGMVNAMQRMGATGVYEISRLPGHPVVEAVYFLLRNQNAFICNLITAVISTIGILFLALALKRWGISNFILPALIFAFIPVIYINSACNMDYMWAMGFVLISLFFLSEKKYLIAGIFIGIATGCRITSLAMLLPFFFLVADKNDYKSSFKAFGILAMSSFAVSLLLFIPIIKKYGLSLFAENLAYPQVIKSLYKASIGTCGAIGFAAISYFVLKSFFTSGIFRKSFFSKKKQLQYFIVCGIFIHALLFILVPHKSAYLIPMFLFLIIWLAGLLNQNQLALLFVCIIFSNFLMGINLDDAYRGVEKSAFSYQTEIAGQPVSFDLFKGSLTADHDRRLQKISFAKSVNEKLKAINKPTVLIAGWWINEIEVLAGNSKNPLVQNFYFVDENALQNYLAQGFDIYYLPLQDDVNDLKYGNSFTKKYAKPMFEASNTKLIY